MRIPRPLPRWLRNDVLAGTAALVFASIACSTSTQTPPGAAARPKAAKAAGIPVGPGPQQQYHVQPQPPAGSCRYRHENGQPLPDRSCTPGATSPSVTQANIGDTICRLGGYTSTIRPPTSVTDPEKRSNAASYGYAGPQHDAEYDHLISLQIGGDPNDPRNLWLEPPSPGHRPGAGPNNPKDTTETHLHTAICHGKVTLAAAQRAIATDWTTAESVLGISRP